MTFTGLPANSGQATGPLCIVHDENEFSHCSEESIVLLVEVKPNVALAKMVKAILAVHGGITSHAAIVARENNKPAIVGLAPEILEQVHDGDLVSIDGGTGEIRVA